MNQQFYPDDHTVKLVETATYPFTDSEEIAFELDEFESMHKKVNATQTLYIPPVRTRPPQNEKLEKLTLSQGHLSSITTSEPSAEDSGKDRPDTAD